MPDIEGVRADFAIDPGWQLMSAGTEVAVNEGVGGEEILGLPRRLEPLHLPFSSPCWSMRVFGSIIQISALSVLDVRKQLTLSDAIAPQLVGHDYPRFISQTCQQSSEEALRCLGVAPGLNKDVEHDTILIDGTPEIMLHALDTDEHFVHVPRVAGSWPTTAHSVGKNSPQTSCTSVAPSRRRR